MVRGLLDAHGIPAIVTSNMARTPFPFSLNELRVTVSEPLADAARRLIASHREEVGPARIAPFGSELEPLERRIGYRFRDRGLLEHALTHRSRVHEDASGGVIDNESLEFLGDSVLGFIIADRLFRTFPQHNEGQKSKLKASLVSATSLARLGEQLGLGEFLILGRGEEKTGGRRKQALIADGYEAVDRGHLPRWRGRAGAHVPRSAVRRSDRRSRANRRARGVHRGLQVGACRNGCRRTVAACRSTDWPASPAHRITGPSRSKCSWVGKASPKPRAGARKRRPRRPPSWRWTCWRADRWVRRTFELSKPNLSN